LAQELPFVSVARLLGCQTHDTEILSDTTIRSLVRTYSHLICQAELAEVTQLATRDDLASLNLRLMPHEQLRRRAGCPSELNAPLTRRWRVSRCVHPPASHGQIGDAGNAARRAEPTLLLEKLRHLGPALEPNQVLLTVDEVLTRRPEAGHFLELRTARIMTERGSGYLSGIGAVFLQ
jgi:hypothetical protein